MKNEITLFCPTCNRHWWLLLKPKICKDCGKQFTPKLRVTEKYCPSGICWQKKNVAASINYQKMKVIEKIKRRSDKQPRTELPDKEYMDKIIMQLRLLIKR